MNTENFSKLRVLEYIKQQGWFNTDGLKRFKRLFSEKAKEISLLELQANIICFIMSMKPEESKFLAIGLAR